MAYVDGYLIAVASDKVDEYRKIARKAGKVWMDHGAVQYCECVGDDLKTPFGTSFSKLLKLKPKETAIFSWVIFKSRSHRDKVNAAVMEDPRIKQMEKPPFDSKRMSWGGFKPIVEL